MAAIKLLGHRLGQLLCVLAISTLTTPALAQNAAPAPCSSEEARQLDFWLGEWELSWKGGSGRNHITRLYGDCGIQENFESLAPQAWSGTSVSQYDGARGMWRQTWVDSQGSYLDFNGEMDPELGLVLQGEGRPAQGKPVRTRMRWEILTEDSLDWFWEQSMDEGASWQLAWKIHYERVKSD